MLIGRSTRTARRLAVALAATMVLGTVAAIVPSASASHFWSGTLSWSHGLPEDLRSEVGPEFEPYVYVTGYQSYDSKFYAPGNCIGKNVGERVSNTGSLYVGSTPHSYDILIDFADHDDQSAGGHCRFAGRMVATGTDQPVRVAFPGLGDQNVYWSMCCREGSNHGHVNNPDHYAYMETVINVGRPNNSPVINFPVFTMTTNHAYLGYGNHHCPAKGICQFYIPATDPDNDTLSWRFGTSVEAVGPNGVNFRGPFIQPYAMEIDASTGLVTWNTLKARAREGEIYSAHFVVEDGYTGQYGKTKVPLDVMIEIGPPVTCPNGKTPVMKPTGEIDCGEACEGADPPPACFAPVTCEDDPRMEGCVPPPPPPVGKEPAFDYWRAPAPPRPDLPTVSASGSAQGVIRDEFDGELFNMDSDDDNVDDALDNCPGLQTTNVTDTDNDSIGDMCDEDDDNDGLVDDLDACRTNPDPACGVDASAVADATTGEGSRGSRDVSPALARGDAESRLQEAGAEGLGIGLPLLGILAAALVLLVLATRRRR